MSEQKTMSQYASTGHMIAALQLDNSKLKNERDALLAFAKSYIEAWNDGMAGDSSLLKEAGKLIAEIEQ